ncbi:MAG TPA: porin, partial [Nitrospiria bacterium]|nr:porin [Nitrospiria bacterium]
RINYFFLAEFGHNGLTHPTNRLVEVTDASLTLNYVPGFRVRLGQFKVPGSEEGMQAIHVFDYINFTSAVDVLLLERFTDKTAGGPGDPNPLNGPVGGFRDVGIQVFESFLLSSKWEHSYAVMVGNGNGISREDNDNRKDVYFYWASEKVFGGRGPRRQGWKFLGWYQRGDRTLFDSTRGSEKAYNRTRWGLGTTFRKGRFRAAGEFIRAKGMIFNGTFGAAPPGTTNSAGQTAYFEVLPEESADGWYLDLGYRLRPEVELDFRYDRLNRATESAFNERQFRTLTLGIQYFFRPELRFTANYEIREAEAPRLPSSALPNRILEEVDPLASVQALWLF